MGANDKMDEELVMSAGGAITYAAAESHRHRTPEEIQEMTTGLCVLIVFMIMVLAFAFVGCIVGVFEHMKIISDVLKKEP